MKSISLEKKLNGYVSPISDDVVVDCEISAVCESGGTAGPGGTGGGEELDPGRPRTRAAGLDENAFDDTVF